MHLIHHSEEWCNKIMASLKGIATNAHSTVIFISLFIVFKSKYLILHPLQDSKTVLQYTFHPLSQILQADFEPAE